MRPLGIVLALLILAGCAKIEVDCKAGTVKIQGASDVSAHTLAQNAAGILSACPRQSQ